MTLEELREYATIQDGPYLRFQPPYRQMSVTLDEAEFLYALVRAIRPRNVLELGTGLGLSAFFIASALKETDDGYLFTEEPDEALADQAIYLLTGLPVSVTKPSQHRSTFPELVYIDSAQSLRWSDIRTWLTNGYEGLVLVHDAERDYAAVKEYGVGVYLPTANGMWLGRAK